MLGRVEPVWDCLRLVADAFGSSGSMGSFLVKGTVDFVASFRRAPTGRFAEELVDAGWFAM